MAESQIRKSTIMFTDMVSYSRLVAKNESHALTLLDEHNQTILPIIAKLGGKVIKLIGDAVFADFSATMDAVKSAIEIQTALRKRNKHSRREDRFEIRIGLHMGQFVVKDDDLFGNDVNLGSRIEGIAPPGGIAVSQVVMQKIQSEKGILSREMGHVKLKNINTPFLLYKLYLDKAEYQSETRDELVKFQTERGIVFIDPDDYEEQSIHPLAVLYLQSIDGEEEDFFSYSVTENLITDLKKISDLRVPPLNEVLKYKDSELPVSEIARRLNVNYLVVGNVMRTEHQCQVNLEMISTDSGDVIWQHSWKGSLRNSGSLNGAMVSGILEKLDINIPEHISRYFTSEMTRESEAYEYYMHGKSLINFLDKPAKLEEAVSCFKKALAQDKQFVEAYAFLAMAYRWLYRYDEAEEALETARDIAELNHNEPGLSMVYHFCGILYTAWKKYDQSVKYYEKSLELQVQLQDRLTEGKIHQNLSESCRALGQYEQGLEHITKAIIIYNEFEEDFPYANALATLGNQYKSQGKYSESLQYHQQALGKYRALAMVFNEFRVMWVIAGAYTDLGMYNEAEKYLKDALPLAEEFNDFHSLGKILANSSLIKQSSGDLNGAIEDLEAAVENFQLADNNYQQASTLTDLALLYLEAGDGRKAAQRSRKAEQLAGKKRETYNDLLIRLMSVLFGLHIGTTGAEPAQELEEILTSLDKEARPNYRSYWILALCYKEMGDSDKFTQMRTRAGDLIRQHALKISDAAQRSSFLTSHFLHRQILS